MTKERSYQLAMKAATESLFRIEHIYWLATILPHVDDNDELQRVIESLDVDFDEIADALGYRGRHSLELPEYCARKDKLGLLAKVSTPVMIDIGYSWGYSRYTWVYADTLDDLLDKAKEFAQEKLATVKEV